MGFGGGQVFQEPVFVNAGGGNQVGQGGLTAGQGAGLVEEYRLDLGDVFQDRAALDQNPPVEANAAPHHYGGRRCKPHGTGAGDHHHGNGQLEGEQKRLTEKKEPQRKSGKRQNEHYRHEGPRDPVGEALNRRLVRLGFLDHLNDLGEEGLLPDPGRLDPQHAGPVDSGAGNGIPCTLLHWHRFTGHH